MPAFVTEDFNEASKWGAQVVPALRARLVKGPFRLGVKAGATDDLAVIGIEMQGTVSIDFPVSQSSYLLWFFRAGTCKRGGIPQPVFLSRPGTHESIAVDGPAEFVLVRIDRKFFEQEVSLVSGWPVSRLFELTGPVDVESALAEMVEFFAADLRRESGRMLKKGSQASRLLERAFLNALIERTPNNYQRETAPLAGEPPRAVNGAEEFMLSNLSRPLSVEQIAQSVGMKARTLQQTFHRYRGMSPMRVLQRLRLERAKQDLDAATADDTVTAVALRWGFEHLGRFSYFYQREYKETPSETLRRARRRPYLRAAS